MISENPENTLYIFSTCWVSVVTNCKLKTVTFKYDTFAHHFVVQKNYESLPQAQSKFSTGKIYWVKKFYLSSEIFSVSEP